MTQLTTLRHKTQEINTEIYALYLATRDSRVKWYVGLLLAFVLGYAISPIDLIPDLKAVFGFIDDVVVVALGVHLAYQLVSKNVLGQARLQAYQELCSHCEATAAAYRIVGYVWVLAATFVAVFLYKLLYMSML
ncbi:YkvA family protein [Pontibacter ruber]|uniref:YkvA family protein n=1 Tax=Pontibacter ruber TaxID=1343895 RepID=A0ABW5CYD1_9BACT|nr:YkvA family protein [Pontibacter ruber]